MELKLSKRAESAATRALLLALVILTSALCTLLSQLGILLLPVTSVLLTLLFVSERGRRPVLSVLASVTVIALDLPFNLFYSICAITSVLIALLIYFSLTRLIFTKGECAIVVTFLVSLLFGYMMFSFAFFELGRIDFPAALDYYAGIGEELRAEWSVFAEKIIASAGNDNAQTSLTPEFFDAMFNSMMASTVSVVIIFSFLLTGIMFKLLGIFLPMMLDDRKEIAGWHFILSPAYAYTFIAAYFISIFLTEADAFAVTVLNFVNVFTAVFAYLGFLFVLSILEHRFNSKFVSLVMAVVAILIFGSTAMSLLAFAGTFAVIVYDKTKKLESGGNNFDKD